MEKHKNQLTPTPATKHNSKSPQEIAFSAHIRELRTRIFWVAVVFILGASVAYGFREVLIDIVLGPIGSEKLIYLNPAGGFSFIFQIIMYAGAILAAPFLVFQLYKFVVPALPKHARKHAWAVFLAAFGLMIAGVLFGYLVAIPASLHFLTTFAEGYIEASLTADSYLGFVLAYVAGLGLLFQLPLLLILWHWVKPLTPGGLMNSQRFLIVFAFVAAAIITPTPDALNQVLIAGPIIGIYQIGVFTVLLMIRKERRKTRKAEKIAATQQPSVIKEERAPRAAAPVIPVMTDLLPQAPSSKVAAKPVVMRKVVPDVAPITKKVVVTAAIPTPLAPVQPMRRQPIRASRDFTLVRQVKARPTLDSVQSKAVIRPVPQLSEHRPMIDSYGALARSL